MKKSTDIMTIIIMECGNDLLAIFNYDSTTAWEGIFFIDDKIRACNYKYKIIVKLPKKMKREEWKKWLEENMAQLKKDIIEKVQKTLG